MTSLLWARKKVALDVITRYLTIAKKTVRRTPYGNSDTRSVGWAFRNRMNSCLNKVCSRRRNTEHWYTYSKQKMKTI